MQRYDSYKPSGVKWLGEIPSHWEVCRFKNLMSLVTTPSNDSNKIGLENIESGSGKFIQTENEFEGNGVHFQVNDVVYGKLRPYLQKVWLATFSGNAVGDFFIFRVNNKVVGKYLQYLMLSRCFTDDVNASTYGAKMPRVSSEYILTMRCAVPSIDEQIKMVSYLDTATAKIDAAIAQQQKMIDLLNERKQIIINRAVTKGLNPNAKMKDSGVEWIGEVPEGWEMRKLKHLGSIKSGDGIKNEELLEYGKYPVWGGNGLMGYTDKYNKDKNAIVIGRVGALCGNVRYLSTPTFVTDNALIFDITEKVNHLFLLYTMQAANLNSLNSSNAQPLITGTKVKNVVIPFPDIEEQTRITIFIKKQCENIDEAIVNYQQQISLLQERKQIIINEVVTGKVKVI